MVWAEGTLRRHGKGEGGVGGGGCLSISVSPYFSRGPTRQERSCAVSAVECYRRGEMSRLTFYFCEHLCSEFCLYLSMKVEGDTGGG